MNRRRFFWIAAALVCLAVSIGFAVLVRLSSWSYAHGHTNDQAYAIAFWTALTAGLIIAVPIGVTVAVALSVWQRQNETDSRKAEGRREVRAAKAIIGRFIERETDIGFSIERPYGYQNSVDRIEEFLGTQPLTEWRYLLSKEEAPFLDAIDELLRESHAYQTLTKGAIQRLRGIVSVPEYRSILNGLPDRNKAFLHCLSMAIWENELFFLQGGELVPSERALFDIFLKQFGGTKEDNKIKAGCEAVDRALSGLNKTLVP